MSKVLVIVGSTRPSRAADLVMPWVTSRVRAHLGFDTEVADLRDWPLPIFAEHMGTIGDISDPTYSEPIVQAWNKKVKQSDAFIVVTPEYNHSIPGALKNAIDSVWLSFGFRNKPVAAVGYSGSIGGGIRAIEHLAHVLCAAHSGLPPLLIQAGTEELLAPDAELLAASASAAGVEVTYTRWPRMWHDFALQPGLLAATDSALAQASWFVRKVTARS
jgi:NAD(P)H-dependent FMN reductase